MNEVIKVYDISIICGYRGKAEQDRAYKNGFSKLEFPKSKHNSTPSLAVDVYPYPTGLKDITEFKKMGKLIKDIAKKLLEEGLITHTIKWGGDYKNWKDYPHFELNKKV